MIRLAGTASVSWFVALTGGLLSFLSPCVLPLIPVYVSYLAGTSLGDEPVESAAGRGAMRNPRLVANALAFVLGFSTVFVALGASASALGKLMLRNQVLLRQVSGVLIFAFGLHTAGWLKIPLLEREKRLQLGTRGSGPLASFALGVAFGAGWTPCIGPILGSILLFAGTTQTLSQGLLLLGMYSLGMAIPFLAVALSLNWLGRSLQKLRRWMPAITVASGVFLMIMGVLVYFDIFKRLTGLYNLGF
ncbi:MAG: cytochrome c biogenesis protein CcdA [Firmicutes bacterium]|nr:cytochrome c biogenesis protein CcdA [Bacillota bacterium]